MAAKSKAKKVIKKAQYGKVFISASFNNTLVTITDQDGNVLSWGSSGKSGFKGTRKSTPYAATTAVESVLEKARVEYGMKEAEIYIKGPGPGRDAALRAIKAADIKIAAISDVTPIPYDGPRSRKQRRN